MPRMILEVIALDARDAEAAAAGGADRLELVAGMHAGGLTPSVETFKQVRAAVEVPVRVMLRDSAGYAARDLSALRATAAQLRDAGADEFVLGFLDPAGSVDAAAVSAVRATLDGCRWTFHRAVDESNNRTSAWAEITAFPEVDQVLTAGAAAGADTGLPTLVAEARAGRAALILAGGGLRPGHVPPLAEAGVRAFHTGSGVRPDGRWDTPVAPALVREWRTRLDHAAAG